MIKKRVVIFALVFLIVTPLINSADIISLNSGGSDTIVISPNEYIEGFFWNLEEEETPATSTSVTTSSGSGGGGGGGGATASKPTIDNLVIYNNFLDVSIVKNATKTVGIRMRNKGETEININIKGKDLEDLAFINENDFSFKLAPYEEKTLNVIIVAVKPPGIYTGKILINNKEVFVNIAINSEKLLFDVGIAIPEEFKKIYLGEKLNSQITLIPMGNEKRIDVTLNYIIKDFDGKVYLSESETFLMTGQKSFKKIFATENLPVGNYAVGIELIYPEGVAISSAHFQVIEKEKLDYRLILFFLAGSILLLILGIYLLIRRYRNIE